MTNGQKNTSGNNSNEGASYNLLDEPWIPVLTSTGEKQKVGLIDFYKCLKNWTDIVVDTLERIAFYRFFLCITQRALNGPKDQNEWKTAEGRITPETISYLEKYRDCFYLYGNRPFLQIKTLSTDLRTKTDKLDFSLASGNSNTLFDQFAIEKGRAHQNEWLIRKLLVYQSFSPGGRVGTARWKGMETEGNGSSKNAPCTESNMLFTFLKGENLNKTIHWNLIPTNNLPSQTGRPIWESNIDIMTSPEIEKHINSYLGRLVPISRFIKIEEDGTNMILANGFSYPVLPIQRDPMATVKVGIDKNEIIYKYLRTVPSQHPWRNLHAILSHLTRDQAGAQGGPYILKNIASLNKKNEASTVYELWIGGIVTNKAKIIDSAYWTIQLDTEFIGTTPLQNYEKGVILAQNGQSRFVEAIKEYCTNLKLEEKEIKKYINNISSMVTRGKTIYWSDLDQKYQLLIEESEKAGTNLHEWKKLLKEEIEKVYETICPHRTPRQLQAFAVGKRILYRKKEKNK